MTGPAAPNLDLLVVGAGTAGCAAALEARRQGLSVIIVDRRREDDIGTKACGDAMESEELSWCRQVLGVDLSPAILRDGLGARVTSSDRRHSLVLPTSLTSRAMVDRKAMGQLLLERARQAGAGWMGQTRAKGWIVEGGMVRGILTESGPLRARCCIDASGAASGLREGVAADSPLERKSHPSRMAFAYREIGKATKPLPHPDEIELTYDLGRSNGGYAWYFPNGTDSLNAGIGGAVAALPWAKRLHDHARSWDLQWEVQSAAGAFLPARTFLSCAVAPGYLACGDAACCVGPLDGAGIHSSLLSGHLAALQAASALASGEPDLAALWPYQKAYLTYSWGGIREHGAGISAQETLRPLLQTLSQRDFDSLVGLADQRTVTALYNTSWKSVIPLAALVARLAGHPRLVARMVRALWLLQSVRGHLLAFPATPAGHPAWERKLTRLLERSGVQVRTS